MDFLISSSLKNITKKKPINIKYQFKNIVQYKISDNIKVEFIPVLGKHETCNEIRESNI